MRLAALAALLAAFPAAAQELTRLYAPKPPAGSAYVRVVDLSASGAPVAIGAGAPGAAIPKGDTASIYRVVKGGAPLAVTIGGKPVAGEIAPAADAFSTIVVPAGGPAVVIADATEGRNDLKAQLRFYNLVPGCAGAVAVADGPTVFDAVATNDTRQRAINPIEAKLVARCGAEQAAPLTLPPLKAGDHFSLFLLPGASGPVLTGQRDETEPYRGPAN